MSEYPSDKVLEYIRKFDLIKQSPEVLIDYVEQLWKYADQDAYKVRGKRILYLELHTCGWSGNEDIIQALRMNDLFWTLFWYKSERGGHYYFRIDLSEVGK